MPGFGSGPIPSRIMLVGEAWGEQEEREGTPFVGASGQELNRLLHEAGLMRSECFVSNVVNARPPDNDIGKWVALKKKDRTAAHVELRDKWVLPIVKEGYNSLLAEIESVQPNVIVAFGNLALWALTGNWGILKWRGSLLRCDRPRLLAAPQGYEAAAQKLMEQLQPKVIPTIHPAAVLREWSQRAAVLADLRRVKSHLESREYKRPDYQFQVRPSFEAVLRVLNDLTSRLETGGQPVWLDLDIETRAGHIACLGISWSQTEALCIPLMCVERREGYWSAEEEAEIVHRLRGLLTDPRVSVRWQNGLYDAQYIYRHWHFIPRGVQDTMISQHALFSDQPKTLSYQASLYADHYVYWKDEGKTWSAKMGEDQLWRYNLLDCVYTREVGEVELEIAKKMGLETVHEFQQEMFWPVLKAMTRGVRVRAEAKTALANEVQEQLAHREQFLVDVLGHPLNPASPKQMTSLFYTDLGQPPVMTRAKKGIPAHVTCDDEALVKIAAREPLMKPLTNCISDIRTLGKFLKDFILAPLDSDGRMRCSYNIGGSESGKSAPKTYRLSSSKNPFGGGANLQTIPSEKSKSVGKWDQRGHVAMLGDPYALPNLRSMYGPDPGYTFFDLDLDRADLQVVVWEADDAMLKAALRLGADIHLLNAFVLEGKSPPPLEELVESHPRYLDHRSPRKLTREFAKVFCHGTNYLGKARTMAAHTGKLAHEIDRAQKIWFGAHPGIEKWHTRTIEQVKRHRFIENRFGYRWYIFDRIDDSIMPEAVAWIPQSTVSIVINKIWMRIHKELPSVEVLLQVHDSLAGQFPQSEKETLVPQIIERSRIIIPYEDPLVIPTGIGTSEVSWGDC